MRRKLMVLMSNVTPQLIERYSEALTKWLEDGDYGPLILTGIDCGAPFRAQVFLVDQADNGELVDVREVTLDEAREVELDAGP